ncbi:MAG: zinc-ribbon domain-containing protein, partial [Chloroflexota bacterium]
AVEPEPVAAAVEPEPVAAAVEPEPVAAVVEPEPVAVPWLTVAPEDGTAATPMWPTMPVWARGPSGTSVPASAPDGLPVAPDEAAAVWVASAREVLGSGPRKTTGAPAPAASAQPCVNCGLPLSANARFCRRCGTRQG